MTQFVRLSACLLTFALLAACNRSGADAATAAPGSTAAPAAASVATPAPTTASTAADAAPVTLTMDKVRQYMDAQKNLARAVEADPSIGDPAENVSEEDTAKYAARLQASPKMRAAIEQAGLSTTDFANIGDTLVGAMMAEGALASGQLKKIPDGIDPASVDFVKQHKAELDALFGNAKAG